METIEDFYLEGKRHDNKILLLIDNIMESYVYYKGSSSCITLFDLVLILRKVQQKGVLILHIVYILGTNMIESGIDGLSRGEIGEGVI